MTDPTSVSAALLSIKTALDIAKGIRGAKTAMAEAELKLRIADLTDALLTARESMLESREEIHRLSTQVAELEQHREDSLAMRSRQGVLYRKATEEGAKDEGPFCPLCWADAKRAVNLVRLPTGFPGGTHRCPRCEKHMGSR